MDVVKKHAISNMNNLADIDPIDKIVVARKYEIKAWLKPAFNDVLQRSKTFTEDDVERLGVSTLLQLVALRDRLQLVKSYDETSYSLKPQRQAVSFDFTPAIELNLPDFKGMLCDFDSSSKTSRFLLHRFQLALPGIEEKPGNLLEEAKEN